MNIVAELHSHTCASGDAFNTLTEMCVQARKIGLQALAITNHTGTLVDTITSVQFRSFRKLPRKVEGIYLISGLEANIIDFEGKLDVDTQTLECVDFRIASKHEPEAVTFESRWGTVNENTEMYLGLIKNQHVDCIGHCGNHVVPFHHDPVIRAAAAAGKIIELNVSYIMKSKQSAEEYWKIMEICKAYENRIAVTTDSHSIYSLGDIQCGLDLLDELQYPEELVINASMEQLRAYFIERKGRDIFQDTMCI